MSPPMRAKSTIALILCAIAMLSATQTSGIMPGFVSAENNITIQLLRAPSSTEPFSGSATATINLDSGQVRLELHSATPASSYTALFVSTAASVQVGVFMTSKGGDGEIQGMLNLGAYIGAFEVTRLGLVQFVSAPTSFTIGASASTSASTTVSTTLSSIFHVSAQFVFQVDPTSMSISAGAFAKFNIRIAQNASADIFLVARGVPPNSVAIFTPNVGVANPEFHSTLTIVTSSDTPAGAYSVSVVALMNGQEFTSQIALEVSASSTITTTQSAATTSPLAVALTLSISTDQPQYQPNATVTVNGHVTDATGSAVAEAAVSVQVDAPTGAEMFFAGSVQTDAAGTFQTQFTLPGSVALGTYTVFTSATKFGFSGATARTTFVVGSSTTPSVVISAVYAGDSLGNPLSTFSVGQTVWIWIVVVNSGVTFQGVIWVQVRDPNGMPVEIRIHIANLHAGETIKDGVGFTLPASAILGVYRVDALVSDKLISQGGTFLANAQGQFALTG